MNKFTFVEAAACEIGQNIYQAIFLIFVILSKFPLWISIPNSHKMATVSQIKNLCLIPTKVLLIQSMARWLIMPWAAPFILGPQWTAAYFGSPTGGRIYDRNLQRKSEETQSFQMTDTIWIPV